MTCTRRAPALFSLIVLAAAADARASFPAGVWGLVDQVTFEPDPKNPTMVRIDGIFMVANVLPDFPQYPGYSEPKPGYMYYKCADKQLATCVMEWQELAGVVGTENRCRGWGDSSLPANGTVRAGPQQPINPDLYPIAMGVLQGFTPCEALKQWEVDHAGETTGDGTTGEPDTTSGEPGTTTNAATSGADDTGTAGGVSEGTAGGDAGSGTAADTHDTHDTADTHDTHDTGGVETKGETGNVGSAGDTVTGGPGESTGPAGSTSSDGGGGSSGGAAETGTPADDDKGCACDSAADPTGQGLGALVTLAGLGLLRRRRPAA